MTPPVYLVSLALTIFLAADGLIRLHDLAEAKSDRAARLRPAAEALIGAVLMSILLRGVS